MKTLPYLILIFFACSCSAQKEVKPAAFDLDSYVYKLKDKRVGLIVHHASYLDNTHLLDTLIDLKIDVAKVFAPEHGFRGKADAGEQLNDEVDLRTGIPIISLYGKNKKPTKEQVTDLDILVFDLQDVGVRFYTYISTLHYVMESALENNIPLVILDRPNPHAHYVDGPVMEDEYKSFVGMHNVPIVYGMTIGEYGSMIKGEGWISDAENLDLSIIPILNYSRTSEYIFPIKPSPNLPNQQSIKLYPSICLFEGSQISVGRGTEKAFQQIGHPKLKFDYSFIPAPNEGAKYPKHNGLKCYGFDLSGVELSDDGLDFRYLVEMYQACKENNVMFFNDNNFFEKLAGTIKIREALENGFSVEEMKNAWVADLEKFKEIRSKYLIYRN